MMMKFNSSNLTVTSVSYDEVSLFISSIIIISTSIVIVFVVTII